MSVNHGAPRVVGQFENFLRCHVHALRAGVPNGRKTHARAKRVGVAHQTVNSMYPTAATSDINRVLPVSGRF
jgi:hypothetical protein